MKRNGNIKQRITSALAGLALAASTSVGLAQPTDWIKTFDADGSTSPWVLWWGTAAITWDGTQDCTTNVAGSGAMKYVSAFTGAGGEQFMTFAGFHYGWQWDGTTVLDGSQYTNLIFDVKVDPSTAPAVNGADLGQLELGFTKPGWSTMFLANYTIPLTATNWTHVVLPINPTLAGIQTINGIYIKMWSNGHLTNTWTTYFDNLEVQATPTNIPPPPPPTMALKPTTSGLQLMSTTDGGGNARYSIHPVSPGYSFVNSPTGTTYAVTIKKYPTYASYPNFQTHMFLIPAGSLPWGAGDTSCDWNSTNLIFIQIANNADGSAYSRFMYKTNVAGGGWKDQIFGTNTIANLGSASILGTWSLNIQNNTNVTWTAPDGSSTNFVFPADSAACFADAGGLYAYFGMQPNGAGNVGQSSVIAEIKIAGGVDGSGTPSPDIDDLFLALPLTPPLDTNTWAKTASDPNGIQVLGAGTPYWLSWTLPDSGFGLQYSANISAPQMNWGDPLNLTASIIQLGSVKQVAVPESVSPEGQVYFQLVKRVASQLQVLFPGETNAPGTVHGKIGTPDPLSLGGGGVTTVTVNACDSTWHIVPSVTDAISLTSTDPTPAVFVPATGNLANGTMTASVLFGAEGGWTVTATDTTTNAVSAGTSSAITVGP
jgi:hypothetical protein